MILTGLFGALAKSFIKGSCVFVNVANEFTLLAVLIKFGNPNQLCTLKIVSYEILKLLHSCFQTKSITIFYTLLFKHSRFFFKSFIFGLNNSFYFFIRNEIFELLTDCFLKEDDTLYFNFSTIFNVKIIKCLATIIFLKN